MSPSTPPKQLSVEEQRELEIEVGELSQQAADDFDRTTNLRVTPLHVVAHPKPIEYLGQGAFNQVYKVRVGKTITARKGLKLGIKHNRSIFKKGAIDLVYEAKLLHALNHPNILALEGVSTSDWRKGYLKGESVFLYLEQLKGDVLQKFELWGRTKKVAVNNELIKRLASIAFPVAKAMSYLHEKKIIFRDLKPSNMGFSMDGQVKLCDLGMAREIINPDIKLTGYVGTILYMAPEVALSEHYGLPADVYSYAMFLYECCSLIKPCIELIKDGKENFETRVVREGYRPELDPKVFPEKLQSLLHSAWAPDPSLRPTMPEASVQLGEAMREVDQMVQGNGRQTWWRSPSKSPLSREGTPEKTWARSTFRGLSRSPKGKDNEQCKGRTD